MARKIRATKTGIKAKRLGSKIITNELWKTNKVNKMEAIVQAKLEVCEEARNALLSSGSSEIIEDTGHPFWACGLEGDGQNMMGRILMKFRKKLRENPALFQRSQKMPPYPSKEFTDARKPQWHTQHQKNSKWITPHYGKPRQTPSQTDKSQWTPPHMEMSQWTPPYMDKPRWSTRTHPTWATRDHQPKCYRCGETGHVQDQCRHLQDVFCWTCNRQGHKQKHCHTLTNRPRSQR